MLVESPMALTKKFSPRWVISHLWRVLAEGHLVERRDRSNRKGHVG